MRFNLGGVWVPLQAEAGHELPGEIHPVDFRVSGDVGVIVTDRAVDFAEDLHLVKLPVLALHTVGDEVRWLQKLAAHAAIKEVPAFAADAIGYLGGLCSTAGEPVT